MRKLRHFRCAFPSNQIRELQVQRGTISSGEGPVLTRQGVPFVHSEGRRPEVAHMWGSLG